MVAEETGGVRTLASTLETLSELIADESRTC
jgi:hypothetical protein